MKKSYSIKKAVRGNVESTAVVCKESFSFLGDVDMDTSEIIVGENKGISIANKILIFKESKGSSGGAVVLMTLKNIGKEPAALICCKAPDFNLTEGAILAKIPYACNLDEKALSEIKNGDKIKLDSDKEELIIL